MRLSIRHHTSYRYEKPAEYAAQILRLTPRSYDGLSILSWRVVTKGPGRLAIFEDGFGNTSHMHTVTQRHDAVEVQVDGLVETSDTAGIIRGAPETLPVGAYLRWTTLTFPSDAIESLAADARRESGRQSMLETLMHLVAARVEYRKGSTDVLTTAADALVGGVGVCQDHAHVFIACCRHLGVPARYVSGYVYSPGHADAHVASHAWAEAWAVDRWQSFDVANGTPAGEAHLKLAIGADYLDACPIRGVRVGGGAETLVTHARVNASQ